MSLFSKLFGGGAGDQKSTPKRGESVEHGGYLIEPAPLAEGDQWRLAGVIVQEVESGRLERTFVRAEVFSSRADAEAYAIRKGQQIIDEQGERLFADGEETRRV